MACLHRILRLVFEGRVTAANAPAGSEVGGEGLLALAGQDGLGGGCQLRIVGVVQGEDPVVGHLGGDVPEEVRHGRG